MIYDKNKVKVFAKVKDHYYPKEYETASLNFYEEIQLGPSFACISCIRNMFKRGVKTVTDDFLRQIQENGLNSLIDISDRMEHSTGLFYICDNCHLYLKKN